MATFKAGQRVRLAGSLRVNPLVGILEGTFLRYGRGANDHAMADCYVRWDDGNEPCEISGYLAPIQPERNRIVSWSDIPGGKPRDPADIIEDAVEYVRQVIRERFEDAT